MGVDGGVGEGGVEFKVWNHDIGMFGEITRPDPFLCLALLGLGFFMFDLLYGTNSCERRVFFERLSLIGLTYYIFFVNFISRH